MTNIVPLRGGAVSNVFRSRNNLPDLTGAAQQGLQASFATLGYKGKNWRIKYRGEEEILFDDRGTPLPELNVVIVGVSPHISKNWYGKRYGEGDSEAPDCFSSDGVFPDMAAKNRQSPSCAACPQNAWGSRITDSGKKAKACQDVRRIAVVPSGDIRNENYGGPMLLRIPPMSLNNLAKFGTDLARMGYQPYMVETKLKFDYSVAYPLITFTPTALLGDAQAAEVLDALEDPLIDRMLQADTRGATEVQEPAPARSAFAGSANPNPVEQPPAPPPVTPPPPPAPPEPVEIPPPAPPAPVPTAPSSTPVVGKKRSAFAKSASMAPPKPPMEEPEAKAPPIAPVMTTLPSSMEDAIANLLKAPSLPQAS